MTISPDHVIREDVLTTIVEKIAGMGSVYQVDSIYLFGITGVGKSAVMHQIFSERRIFFTDERLHSMLRRDYQDEPDRLRFLYISLAGYRKSDTPLTAAVFYGALADGLEQLMDKQYCSAQISPVAASDHESRRGDPIMQMTQALTSLKKRDWLPIVGIDDFDYVQRDMRVQDINLMRPPIEMQMVAFIYASTLSFRDWTEIVPPDERKKLRDSALFQSLVQIRVRLLTADQVERFFNTWLQIKQTDLPLPLLRLVASLTGGHPALLDTLLQQMVEWYRAQFDIDAARLAVEGLDPAEQEMFINGSIDAAWGTLSGFAAQFTPDQRQILALIANHQPLSDAQIQSPAFSSLTTREILRRSRGEHVIFSELVARFILVQESQQQWIDTSAAPAERIEFTPTEQRLFDALHKSLGVSMTYPELINLVWEGPERKGDMQEALNTLVSRLRRKLPAQYQIKTVRGYGYRLDSGS